MLVVRYYVAPIYKPWISAIWKDSHNRMSWRLAITMDIINSLTGMILQARENGHGDWWYDKITVLTPILLGWRPSWVIFLTFFGSGKWCPTGPNMVRDYQCKISPSYPWKIPRTFHQQFMKEFPCFRGFGEVWGIFPGYVDKIIDESGFAWFSLYVLSQFYTGIAEVAGPK